MRKKALERKVKGFFFTTLAQKFGNILLVVFCALVLALSLRGQVGNPTPTELNRLFWKDNGPLELSPERGRYALLYSIAENNSFTLAPSLGRFAAPDVGYLNGQYVSIFAPGVSFLVLPGYLFGKQLGLAQVGSFAMVGLFALLNVLLIRAIAVRMGAHPLAATVAAITFLFGTPAFTYAVTLYQHHISTFLILLSIYLLMRFNSVLSLIAIWMIFAFSFTVDYPNLFMLLPIAIFALVRVFLVHRTDTGTEVKLPLLRLLAVAGVIVPMLFLFWVNKMSYGNPMQLSGTVERAIEVRADGSPHLELDVYKEQLKKAKQQFQAPSGSLFTSFKNRNMINGFYILFFSPDRGLLMFTPVMLFGIWGMLWAIKRKVPYTALLISIIGFNILLYSMWDDPYGGWAFGARYLIPTYALLSLFIGLLLTRFYRHLVFLVLFFIMLAYSLSVNTLGAVTSSRNPPQIETRGLATKSRHGEEYTYKRNFQLLDQGVSKSFVYQTYATNAMSAWSYYIFLTVFIVIISGFLLVTMRTVMKGEHHAL